MAAPMVVSLLRNPRRFSQVYAASLRLIVTQSEHLKVRKSCLRLISVRTATQSSKSSLQDGTTNKQFEGPTATGPAAEAAADEDMVSPDQQISRTIPVSPEKAKQEKLLLQLPDQPADARSLKVAIIGSPNAGKSTLINRLMGQRVFSVSSKVHTTRSNALAVLTTRNTQIVLLDTPGMVSHKQGRKHHLARSLLIDPKNSLEEADLALVLMDASNKWMSTKIANEILLSLHLQPKVSSVLVLNKVDLVSKKQDLLSLTALLTEGIINGVKFTMDDWTARSLTEVENRRLMSHKYKPTASSKQDADISSDSAAETELANGARNNHYETASCLSSSKSSHDPVCENSSETEYLKSKFENLSDEAENDKIQSDPEVGAISELLPTLTEYVSSEDQICQDLSDMKDLESKLENLGDKTENDKIQSDPKIGTISKHPPTLAENVSSKDPICQDLSQTADSESKLENLSDQAPNDKIQSDPNIGTISELHGTLAEYVNTLEHFTSNVDFDEPTRSAVDPTKAEVARMEKERQRRLLQEVEKRSGWDKFEAVFMVSALTGEGIDDIKDHLLSKAAPGDWEYHEDVLTNLSPEEILTEAIREKLLEYLPQEVPYNITQSNDFLETLTDGTVRIIQKIICHKKSHVKMLKRHIGLIAREAEQNLKNAFQQDVFLTLKIILR